jgi:hypothetical protein
MVERIKAVLAAHPRLGERTLHWMRRAVESAKVSSAHFCAVVNGMLRMAFLTMGTAAALVEISSIPIPRSNTARLGLPPISPHRPHQIPASCAASMVRWIERKTAGCEGRCKCATRAFVRSTAMIY